MKINPKSFTFDEMERDTLIDALNRYVDTRQQKINSAKASVERGNAGAAGRLDRNEREQARAQDLIARIAGGAA